VVVEPFTDLAPNVAAPLAAEAADVARFLGLPGTLTVRPPTDLANPYD
jgi:hypothetical protein